MSKTKPWLIDSLILVNVLKQQLGLPLGPIWMDLQHLLIFSTSSINTALRPCWSWTVQHHPLSSSSVVHLHREEPQPPAPQPSSGSSVGCLLLQDAPYSFVSIFRLQVRVTLLGPASTFV